MPIVAGDVQRRGSIFLGLVDCGVGVEQQLRAHALSLVAGDVQRRLCLPGRSQVDVGVSGEQQLCAFAMSTVAGDVQRRVSMFV